MGATFVDYRIVEEQSNLRSPDEGVCVILESTLNARNLLILDLLNTPNKSLHDIHTFDHNSITSFLIGLDFS